MTSMNYDKLNEVRNMYKKAYMPPPQEAMGGAPMSGAPMGGAPMGGAPMGGAPMSGAPMGGAPMGGAPMGGAPMGGASAGNPPMEVEQVQQIIQQGLQSGKQLEEIVGVLLQMGVPQELIQQVLQPPQEEAPAEASSEGEGPKRLEDIMNERVEEERKKRKEKMLSPEERLDVLEDKLKTLTEVIQEIVDSSAQKQASYEQSALESMEIMDNSL